MKNMSSFSRVTLLPDSRSEHTGIDVEHLNQINKGLTPYEAPYIGIVGYTKMRIISVKEPGIEPG